MEHSEIDVTLEQVRTALESGKILDAIAALIQLHPADRADAFSDLDDEDQAALLPRLDIPIMADLLEELEDDEAADVAEEIPTGRLADILDEMEPDEAADVLGDLSPHRVAEALAEMEDAEEVIPLLGYPDETAGGLMTTSFIALRPHTTAAQGIEFLRQISPEEESPYYLNVIDKTRRLVGIVGLRNLVIAEPLAKVETFMNPDVISVPAGTDQEEVARLMIRYDLAAMPVIDDLGVLLGVITFDDLMDVIEDEATEDIYRLANVSDPDLSIDSPISLSIRRRLPWLFLNALTAFFASWVISQFESTISQVAVLAVFLSVVAGLGGNSATQSLAIIVRAIALGDLELHDAWRTIIKESLTGLIQGISVGAVAGVGVFLWKGNPWMGLVLGLALVGNMFVAGIIGTMVPLGLKALKLDPALASAVLVTAVTDIVGFFLFLTLAANYLPYLK